MYTLLRPFFVLKTLYNGLLSKPQTDAVMAGASGIVAGFGLHFNKTRGWNIHSIIFS